MRVLKSKHLLKNATVRTAVAARNHAGAARKLLIPLRVRLYTLDLDPAEDAGHNVVKAAHDQS